MKNEQMSFQLILHAGNAKSLAMEAMTAAQKNDFDLSEEKKFLKPVKSLQSRISLNMIYWQNIPAENVSMQIF